MLGVAADVGREVEPWIVQESLDTIRVRLIPAPQYGADDGRDIARRLRQRLGDVEVVIELVSELPRTSNGKLRSVISKVHEV